MRRVRDDSLFNRVRRAEAEFGRALRRVARHVGEVVRGMSPENHEALRDALREYAKVITPWARMTSLRMLNDVARRDEAAWVKVGKQMSRALREEIANAPTGRVFKQLMDEQVTLITSLPLEAARRVHELTIEGLGNATRAREVSEEIRRTGQVTMSRANLIARTEVARTASKLVEARATHIGSEGYIWRTAEDTDVRPSHKKMNGKFVRWDTPPTLIDGTITHAGQIYNCRCYPEPVIPDE